MQTVDPNTIKRIASGRALKAYSDYLIPRSLIWAALLLSGCSTGQVIIQESSITPGIYVGDRECSATVNGVEELNIDSIRFTIDNNGLLVLNGETIHIGLVNSFETGTFSQRSVIEAIAISADGFTLDWDTTLLSNKVSLDGFVLESFKTLNTNTLEFRSSLVVSAEGLSVMEECVAVLSR